MVRAVLTAGLLLAAMTAPVAGQVFPKTRLVNVKEKQERVRLRFSPLNRTVFVDGGRGNLAAIPYASIDRMSYENTSRDRFKEGGLLMPVSLAAGALLMLTESKSHWFTIDYHGPEGSKTMVLRLDKREYKDVIRAAERETGEEVELRQ